MKDKLDMGYCLIGYMEDEVGYSIPDVVTGLDAINMNIAHWKNNVSIKNKCGYLRTSKVFCSLCAYFDDCNKCPIRKFQKLNPVYDKNKIWKGFKTKRWSIKDIKKVLEIMELVRIWMIENNVYVK